MEEIFGPVISAYTPEDAVADGTLVDLTSATTVEAGYNLRVNCTRKAWGRLIEWTRTDACNDVQGRLWDVLNLMRGAAKRAAANPGDRYRFGLYVLPNKTPSGRPSNSYRATMVRADVVLQGWNMTGDACLTILMPDET